MMETRRKMIVTKGRGDTVTASEIANWVSCPEAWRLEALGNEASNQPERDAGTTDHQEKATAEFLAGNAIAIDFWLVMLAMLAIAALLVLGR
jgi:hypothetical protein